MEIVLDSLKMIYKFENAYIKSSHEESTNFHPASDIVKVEIFNADTINDGNKNIIAYDVIKAVYPHILNKDDFSKFVVSYIFSEIKDVCGNYRMYNCYYTNDGLALPETLESDFKKISIEKINE